MGSGVLLLSREEAPTRVGVIRSESCPESGRESGGLSLTPGAPRASDPPTPTARGRGGRSLGVRGRSGGRETALLPARALVETALGGPPDAQEEDTVVAPLASPTPPSPASPRPSAGHRPVHAQEEGSATSGLQLRRPQGPRRGLSTRTRPGVWTSGARVEVGTPDTCEEEAPPVRTPARPRPTGRG